MARAMAMRPMTPGVVMSLGAMLLDVMMFVNVSVGVPSEMMRRPCRRRSRDRDDSHRAHCKCDVAKWTVKHLRKIHPDSPS
jgi:hypothetical protein